MIFCKRTESTLETYGIHLRFILPKNTKLQYLTFQKQQWTWTKCHPVPQARNLHTAWHSVSSAAIYNYIVLTFWPPKYFSNRPCPPPLPMSLPTQLLCYFFPVTIMDKPEFLYQNWLSFRLHILAREAFPNLYLRVTGSCLKLLMSSHCF